MMEIHLAVPILCRIKLAKKPNYNSNIQRHIEYEGGNYFIKNDKGLEKRAYKLKGYFNSNCANK